MLVAEHAELAQAGSESRDAPGESVPLVLVDLEAGSLHVGDDLAVAATELAMVAMAVSEPATQDVGVERQLGFGVLERAAHADRVVLVPLDRERLADLFGGDDAWAGTLVALAEGLLISACTQCVEQVAAPVGAGRSRLGDCPAGGPVVLLHRYGLGAGRDDPVLPGDIAHIFRRCADLGSQLRCRDQLVWVSFRHELVQPREPDARTRRSRILVCRGRHGYTRCPVR